METVLLIASQAFMVASHPAGYICEIKILALLSIICAILQLTKLRLPSWIKQYVRPGADIVPFYGCVIFSSILFIDDKSPFVVQTSMCFSLLCVAAIPIFSRMKLVAKGLSVIFVAGTISFYVLGCSFDTTKLFSNMPPLLLYMTHFSLFSIVFLVCLLSSPGSFSVGESILVSQMVTVLFNFTDSTHELEHSNKLMEISLVAARLTIFLILVSMSLFYFFNTTTTRTVIFYTLMLCVMVVFCILYTPWLIDCMLFAVKFLTSNYPQRMRLLMFWGFISILCLVFIVVRSRQGKASTMERKAFHLFILLVYIPGFMFDIPLLFICSVFVAIVFLVAGTMQAFQIEPVGYLLERQFRRFKSLQDTGSLVVTPICLLLGMSLPLWLSCAKDPDILVETHRLPPIASYSGIISVGIGDAMASVCGSIYGTLNFPKRRKTVEGTLASILAQVLFVYALSLSGNIDNGSSNIILAIIVGALIEAYTREVDNLVVPLLVYFLLDII
uniref:dolichol kinase n=1 Tax=Phallusia mammillata TaxID=59560 RepID=A0A6F9D6B7_9ASCI|nr:dolichol kinase-like [Phallusia mammillata]